MDIDYTDFIKTALAEDVGAGDITSQAIFSDQQSVLHINVRENCTIAGLAVMRAVFHQVDSDLQFTPKVQDGDAVAAGTIIAEISGKTLSILTAERTALNIIQILSGIATLTAEYAAKISHTKAVLLDTRKTIPGMRILSKYATRIGGAQNHRMGLYDMVMLKDNHIAAAGGIAQAIDAIKNAGHKHIICECDTLDQAQKAIDAGATWLLLDNMDNDQLQMAAAQFGWKVPLEASGGVTLETIAAIAETGIDYISTSQITMNAKPIDIGLDWP